MISVIIPVYNAEKYLRTALDSVLNQSERDIEVLCIDDGSQDSSPQIIAELQHQDRRLRYLHQANSGPGPARNRGIDESKGDYLFFMDADDCLAPDALHKLLELLTKHDADIVAGWFRTFWGELNNYTCNHIPEAEVVYDGDCALAYANEPRFCGVVWGKLYRREVIGSVRFSEHRALEDVEFNIAVFSHAKKLVRFPAVLYFYRQSNTSLARNKLHYEWSFTASQKITSLCLKLHHEEKISRTAALQLIRRYGTGSIMRRLVLMVNNPKFRKAEHLVLLNKANMALRNITTESRQKLGKGNVFFSKYYLVYAVAVRFRSLVALRLFNKIQKAIRRAHRCMRCIL